MVIGSGVIELQLPGVNSLKEKRGILKSLIARVHREFNVSCGEVDFHDSWRSAVLGVAVVSTSAAHAENVLENVVRWIEAHRPDVTVVDHTLEIIH
jgi:uncharacterized protein YlxP (DUF503 family)